MRAWISLGLGVVLLTGCRPSATVQRTTRIANLQPYRGLIVRGTRGGGMGRLSSLLEHTAADRIRTRCAFRAVYAAGDRATAGPDDLLLDVTVQQAFRGGEGLIQNENQATVDVRLVLSDGADDELVGTANIRGKSGGIVVGQQSPEEEAITAVADSIAQMLVHSGCSGPRIARRRPTPPVPDDPDSGTLTPASHDVIAQAEAENEEGKRLIRSGKGQESKAHFQAAFRMHRDPRYLYNLCLAEESTSSIDAAIATCRRVREMNPPGTLAEKVELRLKLLADKRNQQ